MFFKQTACTVHSMKYGERLKCAREYAKLTQNELVLKLEKIISQAGISYLESSDATCSEFTVQFANACGVNASWLATEEGDMLTYSNDDRIALEIAHGLGAQERRAWYRAGRALAEPEEGTNGKQ